MSIKINYSNKINSRVPSNFVLFVDQYFNIGEIKKIISNAEYSYISDNHQ